MAHDQNEALERSPLLASATQIISAHLGNNPVALPDVPGFIRTVFSTLAELEYDPPARGQAAHAAIAEAPFRPQMAPAVNIGSSVHNDYIVCLEDGKKLRMLKRYLMSQYGMTPQQYRAKWGLPDDYPMVAPEVSDQRRKAAMNSGLGRVLPVQSPGRKKRTAR
jgi:predicted transcriptional regulator